MTPISDIESEILVIDLSDIIIISTQTIVLITHEQELGKMADRGIFLKDGLIEKEKRF